MSTGVEINCFSLSLNLQNGITVKKSCNVQPKKTWDYYEYILFKYSCIVIQQNQLHKLSVIHDRQCSPLLHVMPV